MKGRKKTIVSEEAFICFIIKRDSWMGGRKKKMDVFGMEEREGGGYPGGTGRGEG